ncbi:hypothetical protein D3C81_1068570 [compost metagenome]
MTAKLGSDGINFGKRTRVDKLVVVYSHGKGFDKYMSISVFELIVTTRYMQYFLAGVKKVLTVCKCVKANKIGAE